MLEGSQISKSFNGTKVLHDISLNLDRGEIVVLIGPSGSGKTTLLKIMGLLEPSDGGTIKIDGVPYNANQNNSQSPWPKVTMVFQQLFLWPHLTILDNILLPLKVQKQEVDRKQLAELIDLFQMQGFIKRFPNEASLGQRQRAALVRALMLNPEYILLDEITSSLDIEQIAVLVPYIKELAKRGIGVLAITHLLHFAKETADRVVFMDSGSIVESGTRNVLIAPTQERVKKFMSVLQYAS